MKFVETIIFFIYRTIRVDRLVQYFSRSRLICLGYHDVGNDGELSVSLSTLTKQLKYIKENGYVFVTLDQVRASSMSESILPRRAALLYFDDGREGVRDVKDLSVSQGIRPAFFITTSFLDQNSFLRRDEVASLTFADFGAHGVTHKRRSLLNDGEVRREMIDARDTVKQLSGREVYAWSYPHSDLDALAPESAFRAGYNIVIGDGRGVNYYPLSGFFKKIPVSACDSKRELLAKIGGWYSFTDMIARAKRSLTPYYAQASTRVWRVGRMFRRIRIVFNEHEFLVLRRKGGWSYLTLITHQKLTPFPRMREREKITLVVDVNKDDEALLASFSDTCRNEIRRTYRDESFRFEKSTKMTRESLRLYRAFRRAKKLQVHGLAYFKGSQIFLGFESDKLVAVVTLYTGEVTRVQHIFSRAAQEKEERNRIAYATRRLLFEAMKSSRDYGSKKFDLAGINVTRSEKAGITAFKRSFGGEEIPEYTYTVVSPFMNRIRGWISKKA